MSALPDRTFRKLLVAEIAVACIGCALLAGALAANQEWFDRHFLPAFFVSRAKYVRVELYARVATAVLGAVALVARRPIASAVAQNPARTLRVALAIVLAFGASELMLRQTYLRAAEEVPARKEPRRHLDSRLGWLFVPSRRGYQGNNGRLVEYAFDGRGYRVRRVDEPVDLERPSIVFTGESIMVGEKLHWEETIPAQTEKILGIQSANLAVSGFASDQAYLRLKAELPHFRQPVAVVSLFTPGIFDRNLDDDRPHLGTGLAWQPAAHRWRLATLLRRVVRYRSEETIEHGIGVTQEILRATAELARARGAVPLIVVPQFVPELPRERELRRRILDDAGLQYVWVDLDPSSRVWDDGHPDARAAHAIAVAIANRLRELSGADSESRRRG
ncbi:MAG TPA: hypothetical protein VGK04_01040 [Thermoanaerobaculia bacterium]